MLISHLASVSSIVHQKPEHRIYYRILFGNKNSFGPEKIYERLYVFFYIQTCNKHFLNHAELILPEAEKKKKKNKHGKD